MHIATLIQFFINWLFDPKQPTETVATPESKSIVTVNPHPTFINGNQKDQPYGLDSYKIAGHSLRLIHTRRFHYQWGERSFDIRSIREQCNEPMTAHWDWEGDAFRLAALVTWLQQMEQGHDLGKILKKVSYKL